MFLAAAETNSSSLRFVKGLASVIEGPVGFSTDGSELGQSLESKFWC